MPKFKFKVTYRTVLDKNMKSKTKTKEITVSASSEAEAEGIAVASITAERDCSAVMLAELI